MRRMNWSMDFVSDALYAGRRFRTFKVLDEGVREALAIAVIGGLLTSMFLSLICVAVLCSYFTRCRSRSN